MNKLQSFLTENFELMQVVEPDDQLKIDGGAAPTLGPSGTLEGCIPHGPIFPKGPPIIIIGTGPTFPPPTPVAG